MSDETKASATVSDYLRWRGDLTFAQDGFNAVSYTHLTLPTT